MMLWMCVTIRWEKTNGIKSMKHDGYKYEVMAKITFTKQELLDLIAVGEKHYDYTCRSLCCEPSSTTGEHREQGIGGFRDPDAGIYYYLRNRMENADLDEITGELTSRQLDITCKILEMASLPGQPEEAIKLVIPMRMALIKVSKKYRRLNKLPEPPC